MIIGITGKKGHGKDSVAAVLQVNAHVHRIALADALKRTAMDLYGLSYCQCFGTLAEKEAVDSRWGMSAREILQKLGTEVGRSVHGETWIRKLLADIEATRTLGLIWSWNVGTTTWHQTRAAHPWPQHFAVPDVRFPNEADAIRRAGGLILKVIRPGFSTGNHETHASETSVDAIEADYTIQNTGRLPELTRATVALLLELRREKKL